MPGLDKIKLVHAWCARSVEFSYVLSKRLGVVLTVGLHDSPDQPYHSNSRRFLIKTICKRARCVATVSEAMAEKCRLLGLSENAYIALNGIPDIDLSCIESKPNRPPTVGFLGMNAARKGFFTVADWISKTNCPWRLYGDIDPVIEDKAYTLINSYGDRVTLCGRKPPADIYREVDIVVMPSVEFEPFGLVAVEAGRAGLPVVASAVGGLREIIDHGKSGFLYPEDQPELGLQWIQLLCGDQKLSKKMGCEGRVNFEKNFTVSQMKNAWDLFFKEHQT
jgi:glycosyltransferase involved in cell wall biosynthesis